MKVIADFSPKAEQILLELITFEAKAKEIESLVAPYAVAGNGRPLPRFVTETSVALRGSLVKNFGRSFQALQDLIENGYGSNAGVGRLHEACYLFNQVQQEIHAANCVLMNDEKRQELQNKMRDVVGDIVVFMAIQYQLYAVHTGNVMLSIQKHCERIKLTPEVFYGVLLQDMEDVERSWYAWEVISSLYGALNDFDPVFVAECEENLYPLSDEMASDILNGVLDVAAARGMLMEHMKTIEVSDVDVTPTSLVSKMKLE